MNGNPAWRLWAVQVLAVVRLELKKNFSLRRGIAVYILAFLQFLIFALHSIACARGFARCDGTDDLAMYAGVFQIFFLRLAVFFGCVVIFLNLFRGEVVQKSLHYYFLAPVRREVLVVGKYLSGLVMAALVFGASAALSYIVQVQHLALTPNRALAGTAMGHLPAYVGVTVLACAGYGAVFLLLGMLFRNPIVPVIGVLVWESLIIFFPPLLKKFSVIFYLESLCPVRVPFEGPGHLFAISANPSPAYVAISGVILLSAAVVAVAGVLVRRMEIRYGSE